jgi:hypothetical protein
MSPVAAKDWSGKARSVWGTGSEEDGSVGGWDAGGGEGNGEVRGGGGRASACSRRLLLPYDTALYVMLVVARGIF